MTNNIQNNGYSSTNPSSELWNITTSHKTLLDLLSDRVLEFVLNFRPIVSTGVATNMVINQETPKSKTDTSFVFSKRFALNADTSHFTMVIDYEYTNQNTQEKWDSTLSVTFFVKREADAPLPLGVAKNCWTQPSLDLLFQGTSVVGDTVDETMDKLEVQLTPNDIQLSSANVTIESSLESEKLALTLSQNVWQEDFYRYVTTTPVADDKKLQHRGRDSIIVVWRNPDLPLDTVRIAVPFNISRDVAAQAAYYFDTNADGYVDSIYVDLNVDSLMTGDIEELEKMVTLPSSRGFSNETYKESPGGFSILVTESRSHTPNTGVGDGDMLKISDGVFDHGGLVSESNVQIQDKMAPVIVKALLAIPSDTTARDTLKITFSESVLQVTFSEPFKFKDKEGTAYQASVEPSGKAGAEQHFRVINVSPVKDQYPGDSVWINEVGNVVDAGANKQTNPNNRRVPLEVKYAPPTIEGKVVNPLLTEGPQSQQIQIIHSYTQRVYDEAKKENPDLELELPKEPGALIIAIPQGPLRHSMVLFGKVSIFDVVKNLIVDNKDMAFDPLTKQVIFMWDGYNKNGKKVATGTYVAIMKITNDLGLSETRSVRIGVKR
jgi:hypothetical protein